MIEQEQAILAEAWRFPIKSCAGQPLLGEFQVTATGIEGDREFGILDVEKNRICSLKNPKDRPLAAVVASFDEDRKILRFSHPTHGSDWIHAENGQPDFEDFTVLDDVVSGVDQGEGAADYFSELLHKYVRLVRVPQNHVRLVDPLYLPDRIDQTLFTDGYPLTIHTIQSMNMLRDSMPQVWLTNAQIRSNLIIHYPVPDDWSLGAPEDRWREFKVGGAELKVTKASSRCVMTELFVNPETGVVSRIPSTLDALKEMGRVGFNGTCEKPKPLFAQNTLILKPGTMCVKDPVSFAGVGAQNNRVNWDPAEAA